MNRIYVLRRKEYMSTRKPEQHEAFVVIAGDGKQARSLIKEWLVKTYGRLTSENLASTWTRPEFSTCRAIGDSYINTAQVLVAGNK